MEGLWKVSMEHRAAYNRRINKSLYDSLGSLTRRALIRNRNSWFDSITGLLNHIIVTDIHWLDRFRPLAPHAAVLEDGRLGSFSLEWKPLSEDFAVLSEGRELIDTLICEWFAFFPEEEYGRELRYEDSGGGYHTVQAARAFDFLLMHETYHRGQISQILDEIGLPHSFADNGEFESTVD